MHPIISHLITKAPIVLDGAWGTQLQCCGLKQGECPDALNLTGVECVHSVARCYVDAGSRIILTNTFRANRIALKPCGLESKVREINAAGVQISKIAAGTKVLVFASIGPSGKMLATDEVSEDELLQAFTEQACALAVAGADAIVIETMTDLSEALIALKAAKMTPLPVVVSLVFDSGKSKDRTMMGQTPEIVAKSLTEAGADVIGANCGIGTRGYIEITRRLRAGTGLPLWIKPNAGLPQLIDGRIVYQQSPEEFMQDIRQIVDAGAAFVGGCCGTTPDFIRALANGFK